MTELLMFDVKKTLWRGDGKKGRGLAQVWGSDKFKFHFNPFTEKSWFNKYNWCVVNKHKHYILYFGFGNIDVSNIV